MSGQHDLWLCKRAAAGDQAAFEALLRANRTRLRHCALSYRGDDTSLDDLWQVAVVRLWRAVQRGHFDPFRASFLAFASGVFHQALQRDQRRRRALKRWAGDPPRSLDLVHEDSDAPVWIAPTWHSAADPADVVVQRESIRLAWALLTEQQAQAVNIYLQTDGIGVPATTVSTMSEARKRVRQMLATEDHVHPTIEPTVRACAQCGRHQRMVGGQKFCGAACRSRAHYLSTRRVQLSTAMAGPVRLA